MQLRLETYQISERESSEFQQCIPEEEEHFSGQCDFSFLALASSTISDNLILLFGNEPNKMANMLSEPKKTFEVEFYAFDFPPLCFNC